MKTVGDLRRKNKYKLGPVKMEELRADAKSKIHLSLTQIVNLRTDTDMLLIVTWTVTQFTESPVPQCTKPRPQFHLNYVSISIFIS